jgi:hypothetical protein
VLRRWLLHCWLLLLWGLLLLWWRLLLHRRCCCHGDLLDWLLLQHYLLLPRQ